MSSFYSKIPSLTGNQLKIIAMVTMTLDHLGLMFFPQKVIFRILGRLSMPLYAYMIAEGCRHTRSRKNYFFRLFGLGALCQIVYFAAMDSLYMCILITFSLSVGLIMAVEWAAKRSQLVFALTAIGGLLFVRLLCDIVPLWLPGTDYGIDYGTVGVMLPVLVCCGKNRKQKLLLFALGTAALGWELGGIQWFSLGAVPLVALYNGQRGKANIGKLFYFYYPAHLLALYGLSMLL